MEERSSAAGRRDAGLEAGPANPKPEAGVRLRESEMEATSPHHHRRFWEGSVPHSQSGAVPISSLLGVGQLGFWEIGKGGTIG